MEADGACTDDGRSENIPDNLPVNNGVPLACACVSCNSGDTEDIVLLPCLHAICVSCVKAGIHGKTSLFSCPTCNYMVHVRDAENAFDSLKGLPRFLRGCQNGTNQCPSDARCDQNRLRSSLLGACQECENVTAEEEVFYCQKCDKTICAKCQMKRHTEHTTIPISSYIQGRIEYIQCLINDVTNKTRRHEESVSCVARVKEYLATTKEHVREGIIERADHLIRMINERKKLLLQEVEETYASYADNYSKAEHRFKEELKQFRFIKHFGTSLLDNGCKNDVLCFHSEVSDQCLRHLHKVPNASVDIVSMTLDVPGKGKEQATLEKLFGSLKEGTILCDSAKQHASFNVDIVWPSAIAQSASKEVVITGRTGALDSEGKALFFDGCGKLHSLIRFDAKHVPLDVKPARDGTVWLSNSMGEIKNMSVASHVLQTVSDVFQGSGRLAVLSDGSVAVSSNLEKEVKILDQTGHLMRSIKIPNPDHHLDHGEHKIMVNAMASNGDDTLIVSDASGCRVMGFSAEDGSLKFIYDGNSPCGLAPPLKCPSAVCCDPFDNILVADFTSNNIHLLSKNGDFLGCLLSKDNGVSCPNCLALDSEGHLYIGQYGGDILVYSYINCVKKV